MTVKTNFSMTEIRNEVRNLLAIHSLDPKQAIYSLSQFFSVADWALVECELESNGYSLIQNSIEDLFK